MSCLWITLSLLLPGASSFMIHNALHSLCLEDNPKTGLVNLKKCSLDSELQQWIWRDQSVLKNMGTSRCLSSTHTDPVVTVHCQGLADEENRGDEALQWGCEWDRLISKNNSLELSADGQRLTLTSRSKRTKWRSLDKGDICLERLRSKRASSETDEFEAGTAEQQKVGPTVMSEEQREYLRWYYRAEDQTLWTFAMLALSFAALLFGCMLLGMGSVANINRKKIAQYKKAALARKPEAEELQVIVTDVQNQRVNSGVKPDNCVPAEVSLNQTESPVCEAKPLQDNGEGNRLKPGDIMLTWKDGKVSSL
ncbi:uncharacterized protein si:cabz01068815.1 [Esox lucius]|uniref:uncharacterized protein si:cabz01068815.1 n=1 Tax=Esox lucius TaxID=8010 RepID=UPI001476C43A|nr:uncharacterized protein si:cabz01068815.1 [Esox lucius]XP_010875710.2 uncharacterized protein si:cabz01068815.1 [Esox lucius]